MPLLIIGREWRPRTLIRAELQTAGYEVFAVDSWDEAELLLLKHAIRPSGVIFDLQGEDNAAASLRTLLKFVPPRRIVVLTQASAMTAEEIRAVGPVMVLARPYTIGDVLAAVRDIEDRGAGG